jgi:2-polyprenyl-6-methoxyphenol hydroxylase-like FAD-dependent oxidoreductase
VHHPLKTWVEGNVALLGDACHPALPVHSGLLWLITEK